MAEQDNKEGTQVSETVEENKPAVAKSKVTKKKVAKKKAAVKKKAAPKKKAVRKKAPAAKPNTSAAAEVATAAAAATSDTKNNNSNDVIKIGDTSKKIYKENPTAQSDESIDKKVDESPTKAQGSQQVQANREEKETMSSDTAQTAMPTKASSMGFWVKVILWLIIIVAAFMYIRSLAQKEQAVAKTAAPAETTAVVAENAAPQTAMPANSEEIQSEQKSESFFAKVFVSDKDEAKESPAEQPAEAAAPVTAETETQPTAEVAAAEPEQAQAAPAVTPAVVEATEAATIATAPVEATETTTATEQAPATAAVETDTAPAAPEVSPTAPTTDESAEQTGEAPLLPGWVNERPEMKRPARPEVPEWVKEQRAKMASKPARPDWAKPRYGFGSSEQPQVGEQADQAGQATAEGNVEQGGEAATAAPAMPQRPFYPGPYRTYPYPQQPAYPGYGYGVPPYGPNPYYYQPYPR